MKKPVASVAAFIAAVAAYGAAVDPNASEAAYAENFDSISALPASRWTQQEGDASAIVDQALKIETNGKVLEATVDASDTDAVETATYVDADVTFTASDEAPDATGYKIGLWLASEDYEGGAGLYVIYGTDKTVAKLDATIAEGDTKRVTIKAIEAGYKIFLDGELLKTADTTPVSVFSPITGEATVTALGLQGVGTLDNLTMTEEDLYPEPSIKTYFSVTEDADGSSEKPFVIGTAAGDKDSLKALGEAVAAGFVTEGMYFKQTANIALTGTIKPIGAINAKNGVGSEAYIAAAFKGVYDGDGHTISGVVLPCGDYVGLFGSTYGATIKNVKISLGKQGAFDTDNLVADYSGAVVVGVSLKTTIENVETLKTDTATEVYTQKAAGGLVGYASGGTYLKNCVNNLDVVSEKNEKAGGLIGCAQDNGATDATGKGITIEGCTNNGNVESMASDKERVGGFVTYTDSQITFKGANVFSGMLTQNGNTKVQSIANLNSGSIILADDATFQVPAAYKTVNQKAVNGLYFATVADGVATLVRNENIAVGGSYKVMAAGAEVILPAIGDTITLDETLATATVTTSAENAEITKSGNVYTVASTLATPAFTITIAENANATATITVAGEEVATAPETLTEGQAYEVVFTAKEGYFYATGTTTTFSGTAGTTAISIEAPIAAKIVAKIGETPYASVADAIAALTEGQTVADITVVDATNIPEGYAYQGGAIIVLADQVAKIGDVYYASIVDAIAAGDTVTLLKDVEGTVTIPENTAVTLVGGDHKITASGKAVLVSSGATFTLTSGTLESTGNAAISPVMDSTGATIVINGGTLKSVEGAITLGKSKSASVTINDGTFTATDNAVLASNGSAGYGGATITINGGTFNGGITSAGYIACGIYAPNDDTWNVNAGTFNITGGCGICARAGKVNLAEGVTFNITPAAADGWVGDKKSAVPSVVAYFDYEIPPYPAYSDDDGIFAAVNTYGTIADQKWVTDGDGYKLAQKVYVAQVGETKYETFAEAIAAAGEGDDIIVLDESATVPEGYEIADGKLVVIPEPVEYVAQVGDDKYETYAAAKEAANGAAVTILMDTTIEDATGDANIVLASGVTVTLKATNSGNVVWKVDAVEDAESKPTVILDSTHAWGLDAGAKFRNVTVKVETSQGFWFETHESSDPVSDETVDLVVGESANVRIGTDNGATATVVIGSLTNSGTVSKSGYPASLKITKDSVCTGTNGADYLLGANATLTVPSSKSPSVTSAVDGMVVKTTTSDGNKVYVLTAADELGLLPENWYTFNNSRTSAGATAITENDSASSGSFTTGAKNVENGAITGYTRWGNGGSGFANLTSGSWSIVLAGKKSATENGVMLCVGSADGNHCGNGFALKALANGFGVSSWGGAESLSLAGTVVNDAGFHVYTLTYDSATTTYTLYIDDAVAAQQTTTFVSACAGQFQFGGIHAGSVDDCASGADSVIDDFRVYKQALTADQVRTIAGSFASSVATVGETPYYTLTAAVAAAEADGTITLTGSVPDTSVTIAKNVTIAVPGKNITNTQINIAANTTVRIKASENTVIKATGADATTSVLELQHPNGGGFGVVDSTAFKTLTLKTIAENTRDVWIETPTALSDGTVNLVVGAKVNLSYSGATFTVASLSGSGTLSRQSGNETLKITKDSEFTGSTGVKIVLAADVTLTLSSNHNNVNTEDGTNIAGKVVDGKYIYTTKAPEVTPVDPGSAATEVVADDAEAAAAKVEVAVPTAVAEELTTEAEQSAYKAMFEVKATAVEGETGKFNVTVELKESVVAEVKTEVNAAEATILEAVLDDEATTAEVTTKPGLYYAIEYGASVNLGKNTAGTLATGAKTELTKPTGSGSAMFYRVKASVAPITAVE